MLTRETTLLHWRTIHDEEGSWTYKEKLKYGLEYDTNKTRRDKIRQGSEYDINSWGEHGSGGKNCAAPCTAPQQSRIEVFVSEYPEQMPGVIRLHGLVRGFPNGAARYEQKEVV